MMGDVIDQHKTGNNPAFEELDKIATQIVDAGYKVHHSLGPGLLESAYEKCFAYELADRGLVVRRQVPVAICYGRMELDAAYRMDLLVNDKIIVEAKTVDALTPTHHAQLLTYLKLSGLRLGFLINFNAPLFKQGIKRLAR